MKLWLARHAQPLILSGICYGATDVAADPAATQVAARDLARVLPIGVAMISSPLQRCEQLAQCIRALRPDVSFKTDARLREMNFGRWEGIPWRDIPQAEFDAWIADFANYSFGGQESVAEFMQRVAGAWADVQQGAAHETLWVTHAGVYRAASLLAKGIFQIQNASQWPRAAPPFGCWHSPDKIGRMQAPFSGAPR